MGNRKEDLIDGKSAEDGFVELLQTRNKGAVVTKTTGYNPDYDMELLKTDGTRITFEIKHDRMVGQTGNVAFEISYKDKPSGIITTKADYIVYLINGVYYYTDAKTLYDRIMEYELVKGGDNKDSQLILITKEHFFTLFYSY